MFYSGASERLIRVNPDGTLDSSFNRAAEADMTVTVVLLQPDEKLLVAGRYSLAGNFYPRLVRLNPDGSLDQGFDVGTGPNSSIESMALQPDGKLLVAGAFTTFNGVLRNRIARLRANGGLDDAFNPGAGVDGEIVAVLMQLDGKVIIAGGFTTVGGEPRSAYGRKAGYLARFNPDGTLDPGFDLGAGIVGPTTFSQTGLRALVLQPDGKLLVGGAFETIDGIPRFDLARLHGKSTVPPFAVAKPQWVPDGAFSWAILGQALNRYALPFFRVQNRLEQPLRPGNWNQKVLPFSGADSTPTLPPIRSTARFTSAARCWLTSRKISTAPAMLPSGRRIGAASVEGKRAWSRQSVHT